MSVIKFDPERKPFYRSIYFMWAPAGIHKLMMKCERKPIKVVVKIDELTAKVLNRSLSALIKSRHTPNIAKSEEDYECAFMPIRFYWRETGVWCKAHVSPFLTLPETKNLAVAATFCVDRIPGSTRKPCQVVFEPMQRCFGALVLIKDASFIKIKPLPRLVN